MLRSLFNTIAVQKELQLYQKEAPAQSFSLKYCKSFKNSDFIERQLLLLSRYDAVFVTKFLLQKNFLEFQ